MSKAKPIRILPSVEYLRECFTYNRRSGQLLWRSRPKHHFSVEAEWVRWNKRYAGTHAGTTKDSRYRDVGIKDSKRVHLYKLHRIIWKLATGKEPPRFLDHKNGDKGNNRLSNLRPATKRQQKWNSRLHVNNISGRRGVSQRGNKWIARIRVYGDLCHLGTFDTLELAAMAYEVAARKLHGAYYREMKK